MIQEENLTLCWPGDLQCKAFIVDPALSQAGFRADSRPRCGGKVMSLSYCMDWHPNGTQSVFTE